MPLTLAKPENPTSIVGRTPWSARDARVPQPGQRYQRHARREQADGGGAPGPRGGPPPPRGGETNPGAPQGASRRTGAPAADQGVRPTISPQPLIASPPPPAAPPGGSAAPGRAPVPAGRN